MLMIIMVPLWVLIAWIIGSWIWGLAMDRSDRKDAQSAYLSDQETIRAYFTKRGQPMPDTSWRSMDRWTRDDLLERAKLDRGY